ncbi:MAG: hypothetical protein ACPHL6_06525, partial [Rubripirellula sp.]
MGFSQSYATDFESIQFDHTKELALAGRDARLQLLVTGNTKDGQKIDLSREVTFTAKPDGIVKFEGSLVVPLADGTTTIIAKTETGQEARTTANVTQMGHEALISFPGKIMPIFTKLGCNGGGCH